jgi:L-alanine-DL-glutamate epimerase-like enolase superfamily enzyme
MVDVNCAWPAQQAIAIAREVEKHDLLWLEEPVWPPSDFAGLAAVRREGPVAVAAGENAGSVEDFTRLIDAGAIDYAQPSVNKIGGVTEMLRMFEIAAERKVKVAPHSPYFGPGFIASIHLSAAQSDPPVVERFYCDLEASPLGEFVDARDGVVQVPEGAGLGVEVDEAVLARYRVA